LRLAAATGMREGELFGLRWRDLDLKGRLVRISRQYTHGAMVEKRLLLTMKYPIQPQQHSVLLVLLGSSD
jgi:integrase